MGIYSLSIFYDRIFLSFFRYTASFSFNSSQRFKITTKAALNLLESITLIIPRNQKKQNQPQTQTYTTSKMSDEVRYPLANPYRPVEIYNAAREWILESGWQNHPKLHASFIIFLTRVISVLEEQKGTPTLWIHLHYTYDSEGNHRAFRRTDLLGGLFRWALQVGSTEDQNVIRRNYGNVRLGLNASQLAIDPHSMDLPLVQITLSHDCMWGNMPPTWL